jgi:predicted transcriptional regulator of viral defense system
MPRLADPDPEGLPELIRAVDARAAGLTADQVRQRVRSGRWQCMAPGVYLIRGRHEVDDDFSRARLEHALRARAAAMTHADSVIALQSAAAVHGLPTVSRLPNLVHLISPRGRAGVRAGINIHRLSLAEGDVHDLGGPVTTPLRTWIDITPAGSLADSLALGDAG